MLAEGLNGVVGAGGREAAGGWREWRYADLVEAYGEYEELGQKSAGAFYEPAGEGGLGSFHGGLPLLGGMLEGCRGEFVNDLCHGGVDSVIGGELIGQEDYGHMHALYSGGLQGRLELIFVVPPCLADEPLDAVPFVGALESLFANAHHHAEGVLAGASLIVYDVDNADWEAREACALAEETVDGGLAAEFLGLGEGEGCM